jgi:hypothetical protein
VERILRWRISNSFGQLVLQAHTSATTRKNDRRLSKTLQAHQHIGPLGSTEQQGCVAERRRPLRDRAGRKHRTQREVAHFGPNTMQHFRPVLAEYLTTYGLHVHFLHKEAAFQAPRFGWNRLAETQGTAIGGFQDTPHASASSIFWKA